MKEIAIIEDEILSARRLEKMLLLLEPGITTVNRMQTVKQSVEWFARGASPDLVFMDIRLSDGVSFDIFNRCEVKAPVIFTTAYDEYALDAFKVYGIGYLLKPIDQDRLQACLDRFRKFSQQPSTAQLLMALEKIERRQQGYRSRFLVSFRDTLLPVTAGEIAYFISEFKTANLVTFTGQKFPLEQTLEELEEQLDPAFFMRITRQLIISPAAIKRIHVYFNGRLKVDIHPPATEAVVVSREKSLQLKEWLNR